MNLTQEETQTVILALREYREHWNNEKDKDFFDDVNHLMRRFQDSLNRPMEKSLTIKDH
jgi:hypothetical protein